MLTKLGLSLLISMVAIPAAFSQTHRWDLANEYPQGSTQGQTVDVFVAAVEDASNGDIIITPHHGASLGFQTVDHFDAVGDGAVELAASFVGPWAGIDPIFMLPSLPFVASTIEDNRALYVAAKPYFEKKMADANQIILLATPWPPSGIWANKPADSIEALASLRIRSFDPNSTVTMREAGASPIQLSWADTIPQLSTGGIDAVLTSADAGVAAQLWEHQSHFTEINYALPLQFIHMNREVYEGLDDNAKASLHQAAQMAEEFGWDLVAERVVENYETMKEAGMTIVTETSAGYQAHLVAAAKAALQEWRRKFRDLSTLLADYEKRRQ